MKTARFIPRSRDGRRVSAAYEALRPVESAAESRDTNRAMLAVKSDPELDSDLSEWFAKADESHVLEATELAALDSMFERHGVAHVLNAIAQLCDSRVDECLLHNGRVIHHLAREDDFAYTAEKISWLVADPRIKRA